MESIFTNINEGVCQDCGRHIQKDYRFCPWCGEDVNRERRMENFARHQESLRVNRQEEQIRRAEKALEILEKELTALVVCAELSR